MIIYEGAEGKIIVLKSNPLNGQNLKYALIGAPKSI